MIPATPDRQATGEDPKAPATAMHRAWIPVGVILILLLGACQRIEQARGAALFKTHCVTCHGSEGRGQNPARPYGSIAPEQEGWIAPALNVQGHCFLHPRKQLHSIIRDGSPFPGSPMTGFRDRLSDGQIRALIAYLESLWDDNTRAAYEERERQIEQFTRGDAGPAR